MKYVFKRYVCICFAQLFSFHVLCNHFYVTLNLTFKFLFFLFLARSKLFLFGHGQLSTWLNGTLFLRVRQNWSFDYTKAFVNIGTGEISSLSLQISSYINLHAQNISAARPCAKMPLILVVKWWNLVKCARESCILNNW